MIYFYSLVKRWIFSLHIPVKMLIWIWMNFWLKLFEKYIFLFALLLITRCFWHSNEQNYRFVLHFYTDIWTIFNPFRDNICKLLFSSIKYTVSVVFTAYLSIFCHESNRPMIKNCLLPYRYCSHNAIFSI